MRDDLGSQRVLPTAEEPAGERPSILPKPVPPRIRRATSLPAPPHSTPSLDAGAAPLPPPARTPSFGPLPNPSVPPPSIARLPPMRASLSSDSGITVRRDKPSLRPPFDPSLDDESITKLHPSQLDQLEAALAKVKKGDDSPPPSEPTRTLDRLGLDDGTATGVLVSSKPSPAFAADEETRTLPNALRSSARGGESGETGERPTANLSTADADADFEMSTRVVREGRLSSDHLPVVSAELAAESLEATSDAIQLASADFLAASAANERHEAAPMPFVDESSRGASIEEGDADLVMLSNPVEVDPRRRRRPLGLGLPLDLSEEPSLSSVAAAPRPAQAAPIVWDPPPKAARLAGPGRSLAGPPRQVAPAPVPDEPIDSAPSEQLTAVRHSDGRPVEPASDPHPPFAYHDEHERSPGAGRAPRYAELEPESARAHDDSGEAHAEYAYRRERAAPPEDVESWSEPDGVAAESGMDSSSEVAPLPILPTAKELLARAAQHTQPPQPRFVPLASAPTPETTARPLRSHEPIKPVDTVPAAPVASRARQGWWVAYSLLLGGAVLVMGMHFLFGAQQAPANEPPPSPPPKPVATAAAPPPPPLQAPVQPSWPSVMPSTTTTTDSEPETEQPAARSQTTRGPSSAPARTPSRAPSSTPARTSTSDSVPRNSSPPAPKPEKEKSKPARPTGDLLNDAL